jgi:hypothetical protein
MSSERDKLSLGITGSAERGSSSWARPSRDNNYSDFYL